MVLLNKSRIIVRGEGLETCVTIMIREQFFQLIEDNATNTKQNVQRAEARY